MNIKTKSRKLLSVILSLCMVMSVCAGFERTALAAGTAEVEALYGYIIFANGNAIIIDKAGENGAANVYLDKNRNAVIDPNEKTPLVLDEFTPMDGGYDLSGAMIFGGSFYDKITGDTKITMLGGEVDMLYGGGLMGEVDGITDIRMTGGICGYLYGGSSSAPVKGVNIFIGGSAKAIEDLNGSPGYLFGGGQQGNCAVNGNVSITVEDQAEINRLCGGSSGQLTGDSDIHGDVTIKLNGGMINDYVTTGSDVGGAVDGTGTIILDGGTADTIIGAGANSIKDVVISIKSGSVVDSVIPVTFGSAESAVIDLSGGSIGGYVFSDSNGKGGTIGSMTLNVSGHPVFTNPSKGIVLRDGQTATVTGRLTGPANSINIDSTVQTDGKILVQPQTAEQNGYLDYHKFKLVNVNGKEVVPGTGDKANTLVIGDPVDGRTAAVKATATIPAPAYTITIPPTIDIGSIERTETSNIKSQTFEVKATKVFGMFDKQIDVSVSGDFNLYSSNSTLPFRIYNTDAPGTSSLSSGSVFASFTEAETVTGCVTVDQKDISAAGDYTGAVTFTIALADRQSGGM